MIHEGFYKPVVSGALAGFGDRFILRDTNTRRNAMFGAAVGTGVLLADVVTKYAIPKNEFKTLENRVLEVGLASGGALAVDKYVTNPGVFRNDTAMRVGVIIASEVAADYLKRIMYNEM